MEQSSFITVLRIVYYRINQLNNFNLLSDTLRDLLLRKRSKRSRKLIFIQKYSMFYKLFVYLCYF